MNDVRRVYLALDMAPKSTPPTKRMLDFRRRILRWFRRHGRDLPWRRTRDPYAVLVAEVMLQQTQVSRVTEYYDTFLTACPTVDSLAAATPSQVRALWHGLGYYRRANNLHALAREVVTQYDGQLPRDPAALATLPGVGRYTAGAVATFAYEQAVPAVDTNVDRVIRRAFHPRTPHDAAGNARVWKTAGRLVPRRGRAAWTFNQGIMELGAIRCTARMADCPHCPVRPTCATGRRKGERPSDMLAGT